MRRALLLVMLLAGSAWAQDQAPSGPHKEGEYGGVVPGQVQQPEKPSKAKRPAKGTLSWIGFEAKDGGAELFFQSAAPFEVTQHLEGSTLVVHLALTRLATNTWRQIDTRYFDNPLATVKAKQVRKARATKTRPAHGAGIDVRITFKNPKDAKEGAVRTATEADGLSYVYVTFPAGTEAPAPVKAGDDVEQ
jgi:hypothetical protein